MINSPQRSRRTRRLMRFALDNDALRRAVALAFSRDRCVRCGKKKSNEAAKTPGITL